MEDILIAYINGMKGFPNAIEAIFPRTRVQLYIVHQIRSSTKYVPKKDKKAVMNPIEGVHRQIRKITKTKGAFSSEKTLMKLMYLVINNISKNGQCQSKTGDWHCLNYILNLATE